MPVDNLDRVERAQEKLKELKTRYNFGSFTSQVSPRSEDLLQRNSAFGSESSECAYVTFLLSLLFQFSNWDFCSKFTSG